MLILFANPTSGRGKGAKVLSIIENFLRVSNEIFCSIATKSLEQSLLLLAESIKDYPHSKIVVIGGDGMVHAAINNARENPIGLIPAGTGNDFARALGLPLDDPIENIRRVLSAEVEEVDLGKVGEDYFAAICSTGFDSVVNERANKTLQCFLNYQSSNQEITK